MDLGNVVACIAPFCPSCSLLSLLLPPPFTQAMMFMCGAKVGFFQGDIKLLIEDIKELRPTIFVTVPRLLNRVYDRVSRTGT